MRQSGITVIEDDVEIQAHSVIDRATVGETRIGRGTKIDNLVQVGHACKVGEDTLLCGQVGLAGTTQSGQQCILAGQVGAAGHLTIGDGAVLTAQSGVPGDVPAGAIYSGYPAMDNLAWRKSVAVFNRLPELQKELRELREAVDEIEPQINCLWKRGDGNWRWTRALQLVPCQGFLVFGQACGDQVLHALAQLVTLILRIFRRFQWWCRSARLLRRDVSSNRLCASGAAFLPTIPEPPTHRHESPSGKFPS